MEKLRLCIDHAYAMAKNTLNLNEHISQYASHRNVNNSVQQRIERAEAPYKDLHEKAVAFIEEAANLESPKEFAAAAHKFVSAVELWEKRQEIYYNKLSLVLYNAFNDDSEFLMQVQEVMHAIADNVEHSAKHSKFTHAQKTQLTSENVVKAQVRLMTNALNNQLLNTGSFLQHYAPGAHPVFIEEMQQLLSELDTQTKWLFQRSNHEAPMLPEAEYNGLRKALYQLGAAASKALTICEVADENLYGDMRQQDNMGTLGAEQEKFFEKYDELFDERKEAFGQLQKNALEIMRKLDGLNLKNSRHYGGAIRYN